jgi:hypothetical protein
MWPNEILVFLISILLYSVGGKLMNWMLTSEFVRKSQLEADQIAARQIQQTLTPAQVEKLPGYEMEAFYKPFRDVGGDYFDVIELEGKRTLFAVADVSGKGMPAALLTANIQALVRSIAGAGADPLALTRQINRHLSRYTPINRFATAVFVVLNHDSGELTYVNAGHNAPILVGPGPARSLEATGMPLGLFPEAPYSVETALLPPGGALLLFTDGLRVSTMALNAAASRPARASWLSSPATSKGRPDCSGPAPGRVLVYQDPTCIGHLLRQSPRRLFTLAPFPSRHPASWGCRARVRSLSCSSYTPIEPELRRRSGHDGYPLDSG